MIQNVQARAYSEVYGILNCLEESYTNLIPKKIYELIKEKREMDYNPKYNIEIPLSSQQISKDGTALLYVLHYNFWCSSDDEKKELAKIIEYNTEKNRQKYFEFQREFKINNDKIINSIDKNNINLSNSSENNSLVVQKENNLFKRIINFIKNLFNAFVNK